MYDTVSNRKAISGRVMELVSQKPPDIGPGFHPTPGGYCPGAVAMATSARNLHEHVPPRHSGEKKRPRSKWKKKSRIFGKGEVRDEKNLVTQNVLLYFLLWEGYDKLL